MTPTPKTPESKTPELPAMETHPCCGENPAQASAADSVEQRASLPAIAPLRGVNWWLRGSLALLFALYVRTVTFARVYDDNLISPWTAGWRDIPKFFTHDIFGTNTGAHSVYYRPLSQTWGLLLCTVTGNAPGWQHLQAVLMHVAVVLLAFVFGRMLFRDEAMALLTALLFGLHPCKVETAAWIGSSYVDAFSAALFFGSLIAFMKWRESDASRWWAATLALCAAALFTKETMVALPILLAAYLWWVAPRHERLTQRLAGMLRALWPYAVVSVIYLAIRHQIIKPPPAGAGYAHPTYTANYLWTAPHAFWWYVRHLLMPWGLSVDYGRVTVQTPTWRAFGLPAVAIGFLLLASWLLWRRKRSKVVLFLGFWFVLNLAPPVLLAPMVSVHDRYLYLPSYAFCALVAWALLRLGALPARARLALVLAVVAFWSGLTWHEMGFWDDDAALWQRTLEITPSDIRARLQVAAAYFQDGKPSQTFAVIADGLRMDPTSPNLWFARGAYFSQMEANSEAKAAGQEKPENQAKNREQARAAYLKVMQVTEPPPGQRVPPGILTSLRAESAYRLSLLSAKAKQFTEGERYARIALGLEHTGNGFHAALAQNLAGEGRLDEARRADETEIRLRIVQQRRNADTHP